MKLGTRFLLLTLSIVAVPLLIASALGFAQWVTDGWSRSIGSYTSARKWLSRAAEQVESGAPERVAQERPTGLELVVVSGEGVVEHATVPVLRAGDPMDLGAFLEAVQQGGETPQVVTVDAADPGVDRYIVASFTRPAAFGRGAPWVPVVTFPISLLTPVIVISLWILRDLRRSFLTLRDAAVRISSGDLDFNIDTSGTDEFAEVRSSFETMRQTIREEYARRARFTMGVSHDLKTPLALIKGYAEAIEDGYARDPATLEKYIRIIRERSDLLQERIAHLIEFLKLETGEWHTTLEPVRLSRFLKEAAATAQIDARLQSRTVETRIELPDTLVVRADPVLVRRALENLIHNALRYSDSSERVELRAAGADAKVTITVANTGASLNRESLAVLTEPLYRGDTARRSSGFGLGLAIVRSVVESHNWELSIDDSDQQETLFTITIPHALTESVDRE